MPRPKRSKTALDPGGWIPVVTEVRELSNVDKLVNEISSKHAALS